MEATATARNVRMSPRKARIVLDLIRGMDAARAIAALDATHRAASPVLKTLLKSALANAEQADSTVDVDSLKVVACYANDGTTLKRFRPRAMGRASQILKRTCHITLVVGD